MNSPTTEPCIPSKSQRVGQPIATATRRHSSRSPLFTIAPALFGIAVATQFAAHAATTSQNLLITQNNPDYVYFEGESFDRATAPDPNPLWSVNPSAGSSGGKTLLAPLPNDTGGANDSLAIFRVQISGVTAPGDYSFYAFRTGGAGDSVFAPPSFNADPFQSPAFPGANNTVNRWNGLAAPSWNQLGVNGDFPATGYFATNAYTYQVAPGDVGTVLEFRLEAREASAEYDRFVLHKTSNLTGAQLDALTFSTVIPEPSTGILAIGGVAALLGGVARRRRDA